jgi:hypothetical protein
MAQRTEKAVERLRHALTDLAHRRAPVDAIARAEFEIGEHMTLGEQTRVRFVVSYAESDPSCILSALTDETILGEEVGVVTEYCSASYAILNLDSEERDIIKTVLDKQLALVAKAEKVVNLDDGRPIGELKDGLANIDRDLAKKFMKGSREPLLRERGYDYNKVVDIALGSVQSVRIMVEIR